MPEPVLNFTISEHAAQEMRRRRIDESIIREVLTTPEQRERIRAGREVLQSRITVGDREYLVRVFVDIDRSPAEVVTAYKTSKISKYWRTDR